MTDIRSHTQISWGANMQNLVNTIGSSANIEFSQYTFDYIRGEGSDWAFDVDRNRGSIRLCRRVNGIVLPDEHIEVRGRDGNYESIGPDVREAIDRLKAQ